MPSTGITDVCLIAENIDDVLDFYTTKLGYTLRSRMPGFADFDGPGTTLALWEGTHIRDTTGANALTSPPAGHAAMIAVRMGRPEDIDSVYAELSGRGVDCYHEPKDYPWNARCFYVPGPCGEVWEFYAWHQGGEPGLVNT